MLKYSIDIVSRTILNDQLHRKPQSMYITCTIYKRAKTELYHFLDGVDMDDVYADCGCRRTRYPQFEPGTGQFHKFVRNPSRVSIYANAFEVTSQRK